MSRKFTDEQSQAMYDFIMRVAMISDIDDPFYKSSYEQAYNDMILVEQLIHQQLESTAYQNEWFNPPPNELDGLMQIKELWFYGGQS